MEQSGRNRLRNECRLARGKNQCTLSYPSITEILITRTHTIHAHSHSPLHTHVHSNTNSLIHAHFHELPHSLTRTCTRSHTHTDSLTHSITHALVHTLTHPNTHTHTHTHVFCPHYPAEATGIFGRIAVSSPYGRHGRHGRHRHFYIPAAPRVHPRYTVSAEGDGDARARYISGVCLLKRCHLHLSMSVSAMANLPMYLRTCSY